jgi:rRNA processing protein Krr1/Pno1
MKPCRPAGAKVISSEEIPSHSNDRRRRGRVIGGGGRLSMRMDAIAVGLLERCS